LHDILLLIGKFHRSLRDKRQADRVKSGVESAFSTADEQKDQNHRDNNDNQNLTLTKQYSQHCDFVSRFIRTKSGSFRFFRKIALAKLLQLCSPKTNEICTLD